MSQIIENLINVVGPVRFSILSENKIQLEYKIPIMSQDSKIEDLKMKFRYKRKDDYWVIIPIRERFINSLSVSYGIKKKNIFLMHVKSLEPFSLTIDETQYSLNSLVSHFTFDDISWHRNMLLKTLLSK